MSDGDIKKLAEVVRGVVKEELQPVSEQVVALTEQVVNLTEKVEGHTIPVLENIQIILGK